MLPNSTKVKIPALPCVSVKDFAVHARIDYLPDSELDLIAAYIDAAEDTLRRELKRPLGVCTVEFSYPAEAWQNLQIAFTPIITVEGVSVGGAAVDYTLDESGAFPAIKLNSAPVGTVQVTAQVGWQTVPQALRVAVMMLAAGFYEHRTDDVEISLTSNRAFERLIAAYKQEFAY